MSTNETYVVIAKHDTPAMSDDAAFLGCVGPILFCTIILVVCWLAYAPSGKPEALAPEQQITITVVEKQTFTTVEGAVMRVQAKVADTQEPLRLTTDPLLASL